MTTAWSKEALQTPIEKPRLAVLAPTAKHLKRLIADYFHATIHVTSSGYFCQPPFLCALQVVADGKVYEPTVLTNVPREAAVSREETFGPILVVEAVDEAEQVLSEAEDTPYGLFASIMTADQDRGLDLARRFNCGMMHINDETMASGPSLPNGGVKDTGRGRSGHYSIDDFTEVRLTTLTRAAGRYTIWRLSPPSCSVNSQLLGALCARIQTQEPRVFAADTPVA